MKALVFRGDGIMKLEEVATPTPRDDELLIRVKSVGICGSDIMDISLGYHQKYLGSMPVWQNRFQ